MRNSSTECGCSCLENLDGVVTDEPHIAQRAGFEREQQSADPGSVHLDAEEVALGMSSGERQQILTVTEADLDGAWRIAPEERDGIERLRGEPDAVLWPELLERTLLRLGDAPRAGDERANRARMFVLHVLRSYRASHDPR